jgi:hypothetical protein
MNNLLKRAVSLLCMIALVGTACLSFFVTANADETGTAADASATSIFVATDRHDYEGSNQLTAVLEQVVADSDAVKPTVTLLGGDSVGRGSDREESGHPAYTVAEPNAEIYSVLGNDVATYYTFGSHDTSNTNGYSEYLSGPAKCDGYYIYGISFAQMAYATDEQTKEAGYNYIDLADRNGISATTASANFLKWVDSLDDNLPVVVMSHVPLHVNRKDNLGAAIWCEALNKAAETHDVIMLFGHNHTTERSNDTDRYYYLVPEGKSMPVQGAEKDGDYSTPVTIHFTYINAGYLTMGYGSLMTFADVNADGTYDKLTVQRYSTTGKDDTFGNTGISSPYTITLTQWSKKLENTNDADQSSETKVSGTEQSSVVAIDQSSETTTAEEEESIDETDDTEEASETTTAATGQSDTSTESTKNSAAKTGDTSNPVYIVTLLVSACVLCVLIRNRSKKRK